jgi:hypothetical protein
MPIILGYGQSNAVGSTIPAGTLNYTVSTQGNLMFNTGLRAPTVGSVSTATSFVTASENEISGYGQTSTVVAADRYTGLTQPKLVVSAGRPNSTISQLLPGQQAFDDGVTGVISKATSVAGEPARLAAVIFWQGESDNTTGKTVSGYKSEFRSLVSALKTQGSNPDVRVLAVQVSINTLVDATTTPLNWSSAQAFYEMIRDGEPNLTVLANAAHLGIIDNNDHSNANGQRMVGEIAGIALNSPSWKPLYPTQLERSGNNVNITYHVPNGSTLNVDDHNLFKVTQWGFKVESTAGANNPVVRCRKLNAHTIQLTCVNTVDAGNVFYGRNFEITPSATVLPNIRIPGGNIVASSATTVDVKFETLPMRHYSLSFQETI